MPSDGLGLVWIRGVCRQCGGFDDGADVERAVELELSADELQLIMAGLRLLLVVEDDHITIQGLKELIGRIDRELATPKPQAGRFSLRASGPS